MSRVFIPGMQTRDRVILRHLVQPTFENAQELCNELSQYLVDVYPGHLWQVQLNQTWVGVKNLRLHNSKGMQEDLLNIDAEGKRNCMMRLGGELLERYGQPRGWVNEACLKALKRDVMGNAIMP